MPSRLVTMGAQCEKGAVHPFPREVSRSRRDREIRDSDDRVWGLFDFGSLRSGDVTRPVLPWFYPKPQVSHQMRRFFWRKGPSPILAVQVVRSVNSNRAGGRVHFRFRGNVLEGIRLSVVQRYLQKI